MESIQSTANVVTNKEYLVCLVDGTSSDERTDSGDCTPSIQKRCTSKGKGKANNKKKALGVYKGIPELFEKPLGRRSWVWSFFKGMNKQINGVDVFYGQCGYCKIHLKASSDGPGTSALISHLKDHCKKSPFFTKLVVDDKQPSVAQTCTCSVTTQKFDQYLCDRDIVEWIIGIEQPFNIVEHDLWKKMMNRLCPQYKPCGRKKEASIVFDVYNSEKVKLKNVMVGRRVSITTDTWTSIQNTNYMVVTAHFMDSSSKVNKRIINFTKIDSHKGSDIGRLLLSCLDDWGIKNVLTVTVDNASSNDTSITYLLGRLKEKGNILCDGAYMHMRCACHILNLIVKDGLQEMNKLVEAIRNAVKYVHSSPARLTDFRRFAALEMGDAHARANVPQDVCTRWNSTYKMLSIAFKYKAVFSRMVDDDSGFVEYFNIKYERVGPPVREDWEKAHVFIFFLEKFYHATLKLSASKSETANLIYYETMQIVREIEERIVDENPSNQMLKKGAEKMKLKFLKYWNYSNPEDVNPLIFVAHVLDPRFKLGFLKVSIGKLSGNKEIGTKHVEAVNQLLLSIYKEYQVDVGTSHRYSVIDDDDDENFDDSWMQEAVDEGKAEKKIIISNEVDKYFHEENESLKNKNFDLLGWWRDKESSLPVLSWIAKDILTIPSSTVASESAFSLGGRIVDPFRTSLTPKTVEALVCSNDWLKAERFDFYQEPTDEELALYKELEELENEQTMSTNSTTSNATRCQSLPPIFRKP